MSDITLVLEANNRGESQASEKLLPLVHKELRNLAPACMLQEIGRTYAWIMSAISPR